MTLADFGSLARWMVTVPLWQRYGLSIEQAMAGFETGIERGDWLIVAELDGDVRGFAWAMPKGAFGRSPYIRLIGVRPDAAGQGIGALLITEIERRAREVSADLLLLVSDFNTEAQRFYERHGFVQVGALAGYVLPDVAELIYRKSLR